MPEVDIKKGEPIDRALKRLKGKMETEGIMDEMRRLRSFETPAPKTKRKARANAKRFVDRPVDWDDKVWLTFARDAGVVLTQ